MCINPKRLTPTVNVAARLRGQCFKEMQPHAFAYVYHLAHVNKDWFELFSFSHSWINSDNVHIKPGKYHRWGPRGSGAHPVSCKQLDPQIRCIGTVDAFKHI